MQTIVRTQRSATYHDDNESGHHNDVWEDHPHLRAHNDIPKYIVPHRGQDSQLHHRQSPFIGADLATECDTDLESGVFSIHDCDDPLSSSKTLVGNISPSEDGRKMDEEDYNHDPQNFDNDDQDAQSQLSIERDYVEGKDDYDVTPQTVLARIEEVILYESILKPLQESQPPAIGLHKSFMHSSHCRAVTSICVVADFCHQLLSSRRTTTIREVYYHFVTYFRNQAECDKAIWDLATVLRVPRSALGLTASPKGWCCGCLELYDPTTCALLWNGKSLDVHGIPITISLQQAMVRSQGARCILVIEKEGVYNRLSEDKFFRQYPCILITGKGFPDIATRQWVHHLHQHLQLPVYGLCDCNPFGISVLHTYHYFDKSDRDNARVSSQVAESQGSASHRSPLPIQWLGLRPSHLDSLDLPAPVLQGLTDLDHKRLDSFLEESHPFCQQGDSELRRWELETMQQTGKKVELEALNWLGLDFLSSWVKSILEGHENSLAREHPTNHSYDESDSMKSDEEHHEDPVII